MANKLANAIDAALNNPFGIDAAAHGKFVRLNRGSVINVSSIIAKGEGPGGRITGLATLNGAVYAVSNQGGLYRIDDPFNTRGSGDDDNVETRYIGTSREDLLGIRFSGLTAGPANVENRAYRNLLFATDSAGTVYSFNTAGELQPVFVERRYEHQHGHARDRNPGPGVLHPGREPFPVHAGSKHVAADRVRHAARRPAVSRRDGLPSGNVQSHHVPRKS